ncbi:YpjP family protein [Litchfieldia salsa]|uniref:YpjP-like protein n=1 Tax=Litchfieldia salsa TaxID=930152 RepID=A0A1H0THP6_9BACI|nr:YpjP family protein [Litchfieldia salsa]SDP53066.1 YpjP-like protein [Litchfieldia salsa]
MHKWFRKALVVSFSVLTLGMIAPPPALTMQDLKSDETSKRNTFDQNPTSNYYSIDSIATLQKEIDKREQFINYAIIQAEQQSFQKFGSKITPIIEEEFNQQIFPKIQEAILAFAKAYPEETLHNLEITENPSGGISEKIFHIYDKTTKKDLLRFHVRRDQPPNEGHWFNFHYHTYHDQFQSHHELGAIFWDRNTPPQWLS